jgi:mono/diheme cytochrome c family protein
VCHVWHQHSAAFLFCIKAKRRPSFKNGTSIFKGAFMTNTKQWAIGAASLLMGLAHAQVSVPIPAFTPYNQQCNVCHFAYPPGMLPAASWKKLMDAMPQHFTSQVMINIDTQEEISNWLQAHASTFPLVAEEPPQQRITQSAWWTKIHMNNPKVSAAVWKKPSVSNGASCVTCHQAAANGEYNAKTARVPK